MHHLTVAAAQYPIEWLNSWEHFTTKLTHWYDDAAQQGAQLLVFPEYGSMELCALMPDSERQTLSGNLNAMQRFHDAYCALHQSLCQRFALTAVAASIPVRDAGQFVNRAYVYGPHGALGYQDKLVMTRFENEQWGVSSRNTWRLFPIGPTHFGVLICYDSEFPLVARDMCTAGAQLLAVPSCTDSLAGYWRVRIGAQARALENQCIVAHAPLVGQADWSEAVDRNHGAAGFYCPPDKGFPETGLLSVGPVDQPTWIIQDIDLAMVTQTRQHGQVLNFRDWPQQRGHID